MKRSLGHTGSVRINVLGGNNASYFGAGVGAGFGGGGGSGIGGVVGSGNNGGDSLLFGSTSLGGSSTGSDIATAWNDPSYHGNIDDNFGQHYDGSDNNDNWTPVIIRGDPVGAFAAVRQIIPLLVADSTNNNSNGGNNLSAASCMHDGIVLDVPIHWSKHNLLVGQEGLTIAALSATYETRIMIPPPPSSSDRSGKNSMVPSSQAQHKSQQQQQLAGSGGGSSATSSTAPSNIIQLEGDNIDMVEQCLAKMLSIVTGEERWVPTGRRISVDEKKKMTSDAALVEDDDLEQSLTVPTTSNDQDNVIANIVSGTKMDDGDKITTMATAAVTNNNSTAEAVVIKIWEPFSKLSSNILNNGRIRKIQRKTNTIIRRKKLRFDGNVGIDGAVLSGNKVVNDDEKDEDGEDLDDDDADDAEEENGGAVVASRSINDPQGK
jgi:hypothetical protein